MQARTAHQTLIRHYLTGLSDGTEWTDCAELRGLARAGDAACDPNLLVMQRASTCAPSAIRGLGRTSTSTSRWLKRHIRVDLSVTSPINTYVRSYSIFPQEVQNSPIPISGSCIFPADTHLYHIRHIRTFWTLLL